MKALITLTLAIFLASPKASALESTVYDQLSALFQTGTQPEANDLVGWRTGRCYRPDQPNTPSNGLLAGWQTLGPNHGPISPDEKILSTLPIYSKNGTPGIFDDLTPQMAAGIENFIANQKPNIEEASYQNGSVYGYYMGYPNSPWILRKNQDYIIAEMVQNGIPAGFCYYFKLVHQ